MAYIVLARGFAIQPLIVMAYIVLARGFAIQPHIVMAFIVLARGFMVATRHSQCSAQFQAHRLESAPRLDRSGRPTPGYSVGSRLCHPATYSYGLYSVGSGRPTLGCTEHEHRHVHGHVHGHAHRRVHRHLRTDVCIDMCMGMGMICAWTSA